MSDSISDNGLRLWMCYFLNPGNTLRFGGDHAEMEITARARAALNELIAAGAVKEIEANDQYPNREHYGGTEVDLRQQLKASGINPFDDSDPFVTFRKKS